MIEFRGARDAQRQKYSRARTRYLHGAKEWCAAPGKTMAKQHAFDRSADFQIGAIIPDVQPLADLEIGAPWRYVFARREEKRRAFAASFRWYSRGKDSPK
jgi:hypothetical protein